MKNKIVQHIAIASLLLTVGGCKMFKEPLKTENKNVPASYAASTDTTNSAKVKWRNYFTDENLIALIDTALKNNQELNITLQEIQVARNEIKAKKGEYLPFVNFSAGGGVERTPKYTRNGAVEENLEVQPGKNSLSLLAM